MMLWPCIEKIQFCSLENSSRHYPTESTFDPFCCVLAIKRSLPLKAAEEDRVDNSHEGARLMSIKSMDQNSDWSYFGSTFLGFTRKQCFLPFHMFSVGFLIIWIR